MDAYNKCYIAHRKEEMWLNPHFVKNPSSLFIDDTISFSKRVKDSNTLLLKLEIKQKIDDTCLWILENDIETKLKPIYSSISSAEKKFSHYQAQDDEAIFFDRTTFKRASTYLVKYAKQILYKFNIAIDAPDILPVPDGSIDILWSKSDYELLLNIPAENNSIATFYGDNNDGEHIKGTINIDSDVFNNGLILFLCNSI